MLDRLEKVMFDKKLTAQDFANHHFKLLNVLLKLRMGDNKAFEKCCSIVEALYGSTLDQLLVDSLRVKDQLHLVSNLLGSQHEKKLTCVSSCSFLIVCGCSSSNFWRA